MWLAILGIIAGGLLGSLLSITISVTYAKYLSVAILAAVDSLLGGIKGIMEEKFDSTLMLTGFFTNALVAAGLALLGDKLGVDLYMVAVLAFGVRIFNNLGVIRRDLLDRYRTAKARKTAAETTGEPEATADSLLEQELPASRSEATAVKTTEPLPQQEAGMPVKPSKPTKEEPVAKPAKASKQNKEEAPAKPAATIHEALENTILKSETILNPDRILELEQTIKNDGAEPAALIEKDAQTDEVGKEGPQKTE